MKVKLIAGLVSLLALFGLNSCLVVESKVSLKKDGSGTVTEHVYFGAQLTQMMALGGQEGNPIEDMLNVEKATERASTMGQGVTFVRAEAVEKNGKKGVKSVFAFKDINELRYNGPDALDDLAAQAEQEVEKKEVKQTFFYEEGVLTLENDNEDLGLNDMEGVDPAQLQMMKGMFAGMRITMELELPGGIEQTDASFVEGNKITLADMQVDKMLANAEALEKIGKAKTSEEAAKIFNSIEGVQVEGKTKVTVKLK